MNTKRSKMLMVLLITWSTIFMEKTQAQLGNVSFGLELGLANNSITGDLRDELEEDIEELENEEYDKFKGRVKSTKALNVGLIIGYKMNEAISIRSGFRLNKRGYGIKMSGEDNNDDLQFDVDFELKGKYSVKTIEFPLALVYNVGEQVQINAGLLLGFARRKTAVSEASYFTEVIVNGEVDDSLSDEWEEEEKFPNSVDNPFVGFSLGLDYNLFSNIYVGFAVQSVSNYAELNIGELNDLSIALSAKYIFNN